MGIAGCNKNVEDKSVVVGYLIVKFKFTKISKLLVGSVINPN